MIKKILIFVFAVSLFLSCTENTDSEVTQERVDEARKQDKIENEKMMEENQQDYEVRRIPAEKEQPRPDND